MLLLCFMFLPARVPRIVKAALSGMTWSYPVGDSNAIYLTFDDGPMPEVTSWVLDLLKQFNAKATFFCVGDNAQKYPGLLKRIMDEGHAIGNHTYNHLNGWKTNDKEYFRNIQMATNVLPTKLLRPPYGRLKPSQLKVLRKRYHIIMWSVLTQDYDQKISPEQCLENAMNARNGDIVLFHDSIKARQNLEFALPLFLENYTKMGFEFRPILV